jgi:hypothetical protein
MTNMVEPRIAAGTHRVADINASQDGELTSLIRRWMAAGGKSQRVRDNGVLRLMPEPVEDNPVEVDLIGVGPFEADPVDGEPIGPDVEDAVGIPSPRDVEPELPVRFPALPRRTTAADAEQVNRVALLIDARRVSADVASALVARLGERGTLNVCRAYADWNRADLGDWAGQMRREGLHSFHHFSDDDDQALVAMAIDAVDIARDAAVDEVVIAGDLTSALPLVHRLHAAGVRVVAVGAAHTPHDVRAACHEFIDTASIDGSVVVPQGRHRA